LAHASEAIRHSGQFWNPQIVCRETSQAEKRTRILFVASLATVPWRPCSKANGPKKLSAAASLKRSEGRRTDLMTNKSYAITISLLRVGVLAAQIAMSPSAAAQWRDFLVGEGDRAGRSMIDMVWA
jgi:hypothetical protein